MNETVSEWLSAYVGFAASIHSDDCDRVIDATVRPFIEAQASSLVDGRWFFIRYREDGPHIRVRLLVRAGDPDSIRARFDDHVARVDVEALRTDTAISQPARLTVRWVPYEPEYDRYAGTIGVAVAEQLFYASSETVLALLPSITGVRSRRLGMGLICMLAAAHAFNDERADASTAFAHYSSSYLRQLVGADQPSWIARLAESYSRQSSALRDLVLTTWFELDAQVPLPAPFGRYFNSLQLARTCLDGSQRDRRLVRSGTPTDDREPQRLLASYMHMTSNRLGITVVEEAYLAYLIHRTLFEHLSSATT